MVAILQTGKEQLFAENDLFGMVGLDIDTSIPDRESSLDVARRIAGKINLRPEFLNPATAFGYERAMLLTGFSSLWLQSEKDPAARRRLVLLLGAIYPDYTRFRDSAVKSQDWTWGVEGAVAERLIGELVPGAEIGHSWFASHPNELKAANIIYRNHILILPMKNEEGIRRVMEIRRSLGMDVNVNVDFSGLADRQKGYGLVWFDSNSYIETHEREHVNNDGFRLGPLGEGLNEGMTQLRTLRKQGHTESSAYKVSPKAAIYGNEVHLIYDLLQHHPELQESFHAWYEKREVDRSRKVMHDLVKAYGITAPLRLMQMYPLDYQPAVQEKGWGRSDTFVRAVTLEDFTSRLKRLPHDEQELAAKADHLRSPFPNLSPVYLRAEQVADLLGIPKSPYYGWIPPARRE